VETQIVIIGAGLMGTMIARELSRYDVDVIVVEKEPDVGMGETKASNGMIYTGLMWLASLALKSIATESSSGGSHAIKEEMCLRGFERWETDPAGTRCPLLAR